MATSCCDHTPEISGSSSNSDVSVVVLTRNSILTIERCLRSIIREKPGEVLAIDCLSTDGTLDMLRRYGIRTITDTIGSLGHARRLGIETAKGAFIAFVDSDVELSPGCINMLRWDLERHGWAGVHSSLLSAENATYWQRSEEARSHRKYGRPGPTKSIATDVALFRREVLLRHPFDPYLKESAEDVDLCWRLTRDNCILGVSQAIAYHRHRRGFPGFLRQRFNYGLGTARLAVKYRSIRIALGPLSTALAESIRAVATHHMDTVPYWLTEGAVKFLGVVVGFSRAYRNSSNAQLRSG